MVESTGKRKHIGVQEKADVLAMIKANCDLVQVRDQTCVLYHDEWSDLRVYYALKDSIPNLSKGHVNGIRQRECGEIERIVLLRISRKAGAQKPQLEMQMISPSPSNDNEEVVALKARLVALEEKVAQIADDLYSPPLSQRSA